MKIIHRVGIVSSPLIQKELAALGIAVADTGLAIFIVDESSPAWPALQSWIRKRNPVDFVLTEFSKQEVEGATWLQLVADWHHRYPQPEDEYLAVTYDLTDYCATCGIGLRQNAPFRMLSEPKWGRRGILQLNWVFDEFFTTPEVWEAIFKPKGIGCLQVLDKRGRAELKTVVQLVVKEEIAVVTTGLAHETCTACGRVKYLPVARGPFPPLEEEPSSAMVKTIQYFGSGASAHKGVIISHELAQGILGKVRGGYLKLVASKGEQEETM